MPDSESPEAEPEVQLSFSVLRFAAAVLLAAVIVSVPDLYRGIPNREELGPRQVPIRFAPVAFDPSGFAPLTFVGAWGLTAPDPRFGGASAIAVSGNELIALSDSGVLFRLSKPGTAQPTASIDELPAGPGDPGFKRNRDSEALLRDWRGRGWWVGFENRNRVWLFDADFRHVLAGYRIGRGWPRTGFEAVAESDGQMLLVPESGGKLLSVGADAAKWHLVPAGPVSDATMLPDGTLLLVERRLRFDGFHNRLVQVRREGEGYAVVRAIPLGVGAQDNVEGVAVEPRGNGALRLWLITDDGMEWPQRTLLVALDWPAAVAGATS